MVNLPETLESLTRAITADAVFVVDPDCRLAHWDAEAESLTGFLAEEMVGKTCYEVLSGEGEDGTPFGVHAHSAVRLAPGPDVLDPTTTRVSRPAAGGERSIAVSSLAVETEEGPYVICLMRDAQEAHEILEMARHLIRFSRQRAAARGSARGRSSWTPRCSRRGSARSSGCWPEARRPARTPGNLSLAGHGPQPHPRACTQALGARDSQLEALALAREAGLLGA